MAKAKASPTESRQKEPTTGLVCGDDTYTHQGLAKARKQAAGKVRRAQEAAKPVSVEARKSAPGRRRGRHNRDEGLVSHLGTAPFFTLTQLVRSWTDQHADSETLANRRRTVRDNTINKGCPHVSLGVETVFVTESFVGWLKESERRNESASR